MTGKLVPGPRLTFARTRDSTLPKTVALGLGLGLSVAVAVAVAVALGLGVALGSGLDVAVGRGVALAVALAVGALRSARLQPASKHRMSRADTLRQAPSLKLLSRHASIASCKPPDSILLAL